ncbi:MAG: DegT/DnrJ/EryC1/StrS family aminotransferase [Actinobacteria bacterium]|nr:MAG: DegT/DnrJ/EryC1/StrS family aminotransferase [Actinomycetota bacterium]
MNTSGKPAIAGGEPLFDRPIPFVRPVVEEPETIIEMIRSSLASGMLTDGPMVEQLEERMKQVIDVDYCVAVASCTTGLILLMQALDKKSVTMPSFTFSATAHAARWNGMDITFADCDPDSWLLRPNDVEGEPELIVGVHISGVPCDVQGLEAKAEEVGATLIFDAAHGAGSSIEVDGVRGPLGKYGTAEVFSLTPTKVLSGPEGGIVATNDADLAATLRRARNYGNPGSYDTLEAGMNGRMSELHAAVVLAGIDHLDNRVKHRNTLADLYREGIGTLPGVGFQEVPAGRQSSVKDFTITISDGFEVPRDRVVEALKAEGIPTRPYYSPPLHRQTAYSDIDTPTLPVTEELASRVISLPVWSDMDQETAEKVIEALVRIHTHRAGL